MSGRNSQIPSLEALRAKPLSAALILTVEVTEEPKGARLISVDPPISDRKTLVLIGGEISKIANGDVDIKSGIYTLYYDLDGGAAFTVSPPKSKATRDVLKDALLPLLVNLTTGLVSSLQIEWPTDEELRETLADPYEEIVRRSIGTNNLDGTQTRLVFIEHIEQSSSGGFGGMLTSMLGGCSDPNCKNCGGLRGRTQQRERMIREAQETGHIPLAQLVARTNPFADFLNTHFERYMHGAFVRIQRMLYRNAAALIIDELELGAQQFDFENLDDMLAPRTTEDAPQEVLDVLSLARNLLSVVRDIEHGDHTVASALSELQRATAHLTPVDDTPRATTNDAVSETSTPEPQQQAAADASPEAAPEPPPPAPEVSASPSGGGMPG